MSTKFRMCYQNLGLGDSVTRKYHDLMNILRSRDPHVLYISETLIDVEAVTRLEALGYSIEAMPLSSERIWAAIKESVVYKREIKYEVPNFPAIWLEIGRGKNSFYVCGLYREFTRPGEGKASRRVAKQRERFRDFLEKASEAASTGKEIHILGDWNLNHRRWIQNGNGIPGWKYAGMVDDLHDYLLNNGFVNSVDQITRISGKLESVLDLHITNAPQMTKRVMLTGDTKSDHMTLTVTRAKNDQVAPPVNEGRSWSKVNWIYLKALVTECHKNTLKRMCWVRDVNELTNRFVAWANVLLDNETPVKKTVFKNRYTPWMNPDILKMIREKTAALKKWRRTSLEAHKMAYVKLKNKVSNVCRDAQVRYWDNQLSDAWDSEAIWKHAYEYVGQKSAGAPSQIIVDGKLISDPEGVANGCLEALTKKVKRIKAKIPPTNRDPIDYTREYAASKNFCTFKYPSCNLTRGVGYREVKRAIKGLKNTDACGHDHLSTRFIKMLRAPLLHVLTCICNRSFEQRVFPDLYKLGRVCLLCKDTTDKQNPEKYRPVSVLPAPSKVLEKVVVDRLIGHMERTGFFPDEQHGYRRGRSCQTAVLTLQDEVLRDLEKGTDSILVFCDLSAAFDTPNNP